MQMAKRGLILLAALIGIGRLFITPRLELPTAEGSYEAFSHLFVGGLIGAWIMGRCTLSLGQKGDDNGQPRTVARSATWFCFWLAIGISLIELVCFMIQKRAA